MPTCLQGDPAPAGYAYCSTPTGGSCQACYDNAHPYFVATSTSAPTPPDLTTGWGKQINDLYHALYGRDVREVELWPITEWMRKAYRTTAEIRQFIINQSGPPTVSQPPANGPTPPGKMCTAVGLQCAPWQKLGQGSDGCPACVIDSSMLLVAGGAAVAALLLMRRR
jgi:hypothetical protein